MSEAIKNQEDSSTDLKKDAPKIREPLPDPSPLSSSLPHVPIPEPEAIISPARRRLTAQYRIGYPERN